MNYSGDDEGKMIPDDDSDDDESYAPSEDEDGKIKVTCVVKGHHCNRRTVHRAR